MTTLNTTWKWAISALKLRTWFLVASGVAAVLLIALLVTSQIATGAYDDRLFAAAVFALAFGLITVAPMLLWKDRQRWALVALGAGLLVMCFVPYLLLNL